MYFFHFFRVYVPVSVSYLSAKSKGWEQVLAQVIASSYHALPCFLTFSIEVRIVQFFLQKQQMA